MKGADLFADSRKQNVARAAPLAVRMRPRTLDEFAGQRHFMGEGMLLRRMIQADRLMSLIFYGPPGTGKTTLGRIIADTTRSHFAYQNASSANVKEVRSVLDEARGRLENGGARTVLFLDELHRFNKAQQDILLGDVEDGVIVLIGATTENPFFAINSALVSRSQIFQFTPLGKEDIRTVLQRAVSDAERGYGNLPLDITDEAIEHWVTTSDGDARRALTALEIAVRSQRADTEAGPVHINLAVAEQSIQRKAILYDRLGDQHYDHASAFIKSMRGSDPDAALYWLALMLEAGEDPRFIARRIAIFASEDIGNADPQAIQVAAAMYDLVLKLGMPECQFTLAQAVTYMATAPKSRASTSAIGKAQADVREGRTLPVPKKLRDSHYAGAKRLDHGKETTEETEADYFGVDAIYYEPSNLGYEQQIRARLDTARDQMEQPQ
jgi:putative ATPase